MEINEIKLNSNQKINKEKEKEEIKQKMKEIYKLSLIEKKRIILRELEKEFIEPEKIKDLLLMDNNNENLIFKYILSLNKNIIINEMQKYSSYMSILKIKEYKIWKRNSRI